MNKILNKLHGKKLLIAGIVNSVTAYALTKGFITLDELALINGIMFALGLADTYAVQKTK